MYRKDLLPGCNGRRPAFIVIFNDVGDESDIADPRLGIEHAVPVFIRGDVLIAMPAQLALPENGFRKIEHGAEIAVLSDEIPDLIRLLIKDFTH